MSKVIVLTGDVIEKKLAGPGIRAIEISRFLGRSNSVTLGCPKSNLASSDFPFDLYEFSNVPTREFLENFDVIIAPGSIVLPERISKPIVVDLYDPYILSNLARFDWHNPVDRDKIETDLQTLSSKLYRGDFFICASEKQRDFWLGMLAAHQRINPLHFSEDPDYYKLLEIVPFGIPSIPPDPDLPNPYSQSPDISKWLVWGGGIWNWFDPISFLKGFQLCEAQYPELGVFFMGTRHPNVQMPEMERAKETIDFVESSPDLSHRVYFGEWIPYAARSAYLTHAIAGISTHFPHLETRFSFRTRILDYIWARLPVICTQGDALADLVEREGLGIAVRPNNPEDICKAISRLVADPIFHANCKKNIDRISSKFAWDVILAPLDVFCRNPHRAIDSDKIRFPGSDLNETYLTGCESMNMPAGEIFGSVTVTQEFFCSKAGLSRIDLLFASYARKNNGILMLNLLNAKKLVVKQIALEMSDIKDNMWITLRFEPIIDSQNKTYTIHISSGGSSVINCVTVWTDSTVQGVYKFGKEIRQGSISFRAFASTACQNIAPNKRNVPIMERLTGVIKCFCRK